MTAKELSEMSLREQSDWAHMRTTEQVIEQARQPFLQVRSWRVREAILKQLPDLTRKEDRSAVLAAIGTVTESQQLREALRKHVIHPTRRVNGQHGPKQMACAECFSVWPATESEVHKSDCLAAWPT